MSTLTILTIGEQSLALIDIFKVNVLVQARKTFNYIEETANSLAFKGQLQYPQFAFLDDKHLKTYLAAINKIWGTSYIPKQLASVRHEGKRYYYILIDGERRYRAFKHLWEFGCDCCLEEYGREKPGVCFMRHYPKGVIAILRKNIDPTSALEIQYSANTYDKPLLYEEAEGLAKFYHYLKTQDPALTKKKFANKVGKSVDIVTLILRYDKLPQAFQDEVVSGKMKMRVAAQLARLIEANFPVEQVAYWHDYAVAHRLSEETLSKKITGILNSIKPQTELLFEIPCDRQAISSAIQLETQRALMQAIDYFRRISELFANGRVPATESPMKIAPVIKLFCEVLKQERSLLPHLRSVRELEELKPEVALKRLEKLAIEVSKTLESKEVVSGANMEKS